MAVFSGVLVSVQSRMNGEISAVIGQPIEAAVWSFGTGLAVLSAILLLVPRVRAGVRRIPAALRAGELRWWQCLGGLLGGTFVAGQTYAVPIIGVALFTVAAVAGQTGSGLLVDRFGIGPGGPKPVKVTRVVAACLAVGGVAVAVSERLGAAGFAVLPVVLVFLFGGFAAVQQGTNGRVNGVSGDPLATTWMNFLTGTTLLVVVAAVERLSGRFHPVSLTGIPLWAWWGGLCGIGFIAIAAWAVKHLGVLLFGLAVLTGQLTSAVTLDLLNADTRDGVGPLVLVGVAITFAAAALAGWAARPRRAA